MHWSSGIPTDEAEVSSARTGGTRTLLKKPDPWLARAISHSSRLPPFSPGLAELRLPPCVAGRSRGNRRLPRQRHVQPFPGAVPLLRLVRIPRTDSTKLPCPRTGRHSRPCHRGQSCACDRLPRGSHTARLPEPPRACTTSRPTRRHDPKRTDAGRSRSGVSRRFFPIRCRRRGCARPAICRRWGNARRRSLWERRRRFRARARARRLQSRSRSAGCR